MHRTSKTRGYFECRKVQAEEGKSYRIPAYLRYVLPEDREKRILDIGCGFGQLLAALRGNGHKNLFGIDISEEAVSWCKKNDLNVRLISVQEFCENSPEQRFDLVVMCHILEHIEKGNIINTLRLIKERLLRDRGRLLITVPNAQSNTGCYWAYEDFTHTTIFTTGSLYYVLRAAGFDSIEFIDTDCTEGMRSGKKMIRKSLLALYRINMQFWNKVTSSSYHKPSPQIFSFEIKALAQSL